MPPSLVTVKDAAAELGVSHDTVRRWDKRGLIRAFRNDLNHRTFRIEEIRRLHNKVNGSSAENNFRIRKSRKKTAYTSIELFSGAGGTALGLENAGLRHSLMVEIDRDSAQTLKKNRPKWGVVQDDISRVSFKGLKADVIEGGFPCQAFSFAGLKRGFEDTRGTLFFEFARSIKEVQPKVVVGENVRGLYRHDGGRTLETMVNALEEVGYDVVYKVLRAHYLDVPQKRERLIILGVRKDLKMPFLFPKEKNYTISMREALTGVPVSAGQSYPAGKKSVMAKIPAGGYWRDLPPRLQRQYMGASYHLGGGKTGMARRLSWDEPSLTLTCAPAQKQTERCHPDETRPLTVREYARLQTFPDDWEFSGSVASQYKQIGNAVPVNLAYHIGRCVIAMLDNKPDWRTMEEVTPASLPRELHLV